MGESKGEVEGKGKEGGERWRKRDWRGEVSPH